LVQVCTDSSKVTLNESESRLILQSGKKLTEVEKIVVLLGSTGHGTIYFFKSVSYMT